MSLKEAKFGASAAVLAVIVAIALAPAAFAKGNGQTLRPQPMLDLSRVEAISGLVPADRHYGPVETGKSHAIDEIDFFAGESAAHGRELWMARGLEAASKRIAPELVSDIRPGPQGSDPAELTRIESAPGWLYFSADDGLHGVEPWRTNGTITEMVADVRPGPAGSDPRSFVQLGETVFFSADDGVAGRELWRTAGPGAELAADINPGPGGSNPGELTAVNKWGNDLDHWVSRFVPGRKIVEAHLYFAADDGVHGRELWVSDGANIQMRSDLNPGPSGSDPSSLLQVNEEGDVHLRFAADDGTHGRELWRADPKAVGLIADVRPGPEGSAPTEIVAGIGGATFFAADDGVHGREVWVADAAGTRLVADTWPGPNGSNPSELASGGPEVSYSAYSPEHGREPRHSGKPGFLVRDINPGPASSNPSAVRHGLFAADDGVHGRELWTTVSNPEPSALMLSELNPGPAGSDPRFMGARVIGRSGSGREQIYRVVPCRRCLPAARLLNRRVRIDRKGRMKLRLACPDREEACYGAVRFRFLKSRGVRKSRAFGTRFGFFGGKDRGVVRLKLRPRYRKLVYRRGARFRLRISSGSTLRRDRVITGRVGKRLRGPGRQVPRVRARR